MQGLSFKELVEKGKTPRDWRKSLYYHYYEFPGFHSVRAHYGVKMERYKLMHFYVDDNWELYDESLNIYKHENIDWSFRQLYTNNDRAIRARVPNLENKETGGPYFRASGGDGSYPLFIGTNNEYAQKGWK